jgi:hypothetical protein
MSEFDKNNSEIIRLTQERLNQIVDKSNCRCEAVNRKLAKASIKAISDIKSISLKKAQMLFEGMDARVDSCCVLCCTCHMEKFSEELNWRMI